MRIDIRPQELPGIPGVTVVTGAKANQISWASVPYRVAVYGATSNNRGSALKIGDTLDNVFTHTLSTTLIYYYWLRAIDEFGNEVGLWTPNSLSTPYIAADGKINLSTDVLGQLSSSNVTGLGALALLNSINLSTDTTGALTTAQISGLGTLATQNSVNASTQVTNLGSLAYANSIAANQIGAGTLAAGVVYAGTMSADKITSGTLASGVVYAGTMSADKITSGTVNANNVQFSTTAGTISFGAYIGGAAPYTCMLINTSAANWGVHTGGSIYTGGSLVCSSSLNAGSLNIVGNTSSVLTGSTSYEALRVQSPGGTVHALRGINTNKGSSGIVGTTNGYDFYADGSGVNYGPFTGAHDALLYNDEAVTLGDIYIDKKCIVRRNTSNTIFLCEVSSRPYQKGALGVAAAEAIPLGDVEPAAFVREHYPYYNYSNAEYRKSGEPELSTVPLLDQSYFEYKNIMKVVSVNALGEGQVNVCGEGGDIAIGDLIVTSSMPGKGMRQSDDILRGYTVAKAREAVTFSDVTEVKSVACIYLCG